MRSRQLWSIPIWPFRRAVHQVSLILLGGGLLTVAFNYRLFSATLSAFPTSFHHGLFLVSLGFVLFGVHLVLLTLVSSRFLIKPLLTVLIIVAAPVAYFSDRYGTIVDDAMILNLLRTDTAEVTDLITPELLFRVLVLGGLSVALLWRIKVAHTNFARVLVQKLLLMAAAVIVITVSLFSFSAEYATFFREHKSLRFYSNPIYPIYSVMGVALESLSTPDHGPIIRVARNAAIVEDGSKPELMILVVGETARADHFSLYGYPRQTNPELRKLQKELFVFDKVESCGTSTAVSLPCMFSLSGRVEFDFDAAGRTDNVLDVLQRTGVDVLWRDNNSDSKGVALRVPYESFKTAGLNRDCEGECRDIGMLSGLQNWIDGRSGDGMVVLHQMGNHGPAYWRRYPPAFDRYAPACQNNDISACTDEEIINAYDNAILYTDWFLVQVIRLLRENTDKFEVAMLYVSDHGESLGERGIYLHGMPFAIAPKAQTHVPALLWFGNLDHVNASRLRSHVHEATSHDAISYTLLEYFEVKRTGLASGDPLFVSNAGT